MVDLKQEEGKVLENKVVTEAEIMDLWKQMTTNIKWASKGEVSLTLEKVEIK